MNDMTSSEFEALLTAQRSAMNRDASAPVSAETPTLTKAELAELLFDSVGLNKREAKDMVEAFFEVIRDALENGEASSCRASEISSCATSRSVRGATRKRARRFRSRPVAWSRSTRARS